MPPASTRRKLSKAIESRRSRILTAAAQHLALARRFLGTAVFLELSSCHGFTHDTAESRKHLAIARRLLALL